LLSAKCAPYYIAATKTIHRAEFQVRNSALFLCRQKSFSVLSVVQVNTRCLFVGAAGINRRVVLGFSGQQYKKAVEKASS
jgi:hypothetical protein